MFDSIGLVRAQVGLIVWIFFHHATEKQDYLRTSADKQYVEIFINGFDKKKLWYWLSFLKPSIVHHQGSYRFEVVEAAASLRLPIVTGVHFWNEVIELHPTYRNYNILQNKHMHSKHRHFDRIAEQALLYVPSEFVQKCIKEICAFDVQDVVYSCKPIDCSKQTQKAIADRKWITILSIHHLKGGLIFKHLVETFPNEQFLGFDVEGMSSCSKDLRALSHRVPNLTIKKFVDNIGEFLKDTKILIVGSQVDETFCRALYEGMAHGCVCLCTNLGNLPFLGKEGVILMTSNDPADWAKKVRELLNTNTSSLSVSHATSSLQVLHERAINRAKQITVANFCAVLDKAFRRSPRNRIGQMTVWGAQGLGVQSKTYCEVLEEHGFECSVFSFMPYNAANFKKTPEWARERVYYSGNIREKITDAEVLNFIRTYDIGVMIIPEICFSRIFEVAMLLRKHHVRVVAVPNLEICRASEMHKYETSFDRVLANNHLTQNKLRTDFGLASVYTGYALKPVLGLTPGPSPSLALSPEKLAGRALHFLCIGGNNPFLRKNVHRVISVFEQLDVLGFPFHLTITMNSAKTCQTISPNISLHNRYYTNEEIAALYQSHDVYCQVSTNEGLGINLFECLMANMFVVTLDTAPFNELIQSGVNGVCIPVREVAMVDNPEAVIPGNDFLDADLIAAIKTLPAAHIINRKKENHDAHWLKQWSDFASRFLNACVF